MNASKANLINSISLIVLGLWGFIDSSSTTALIPVIIGGSLLGCTNKIKEGNKPVSYTHLPLPTIYSV